MGIVARRAKGAILLATDFSNPARRAYTYALVLASALKSRLILLHVITAPAGFETWFPSAHRALGPLKTKALLELGRMVRTAEDRGITTEYKLVIGVPEVSILQMANESPLDLIAMGTHGRTGWDRLQVGSTAEIILRNAPCPVLTVRAAPATNSLPLSRVKLSRVLVAIDFSPSSAAALQSAAKLVRRLNARATLVHAVTHPSSSSLKPSNGRERYGAYQRLQKMRAASQGIQGVSDRIVAPGDPSEVILDLAKGVRADLIVMGTHGRGVVQRLVLGSVAESIVQRASCPVLVVKASTKDSGVARMTPLDR